MKPIHSIPALLGLAFAGLALSSCDPRAAIDALRSAPRTAHETYAESLRGAGLDSTVLGRDWLVASDSALRAPLEMSVPSQEFGSYRPDEARAVAWRVTVREGERLHASVRADGLPLRLFLDLFRADTADDGSYRHLVSATPAPLPDSAAAVVTLEYEATRDTTFLLRLQPELLRAGRYELTITVASILAFPVEGGDNRSVQSFYGASRDGGQRGHEGIDIFAARGTPVLASTDGNILSTRPNELGGKVVWLRDDARDQSLYHAHLDSVLVSQGMTVRLGDTLGFVGNTGNARTTPPHLHFGVYRRPGGAVDPWPQVRQPSQTLPSQRADTALVGRLAEVFTARTVLRREQSSRGDSVRSLTRGTAVRIMAATGDSYRVQLPSGEAGYLTRSAVRAAGE